MRRLDINDLHPLDNVSSRNENALSDMKRASDAFVTINILYGNVRHTWRMAQKQFLSFAGVHNSRLATAQLTADLT